MKIKILILAIIVAVVLIFVFNPFADSENVQSTPFRTSTKTVERGNLIIAINSTGIVEPIQTVELKSKASGEIVEFPFEEGDIVTEGQQIVRLDPITAQNDFDQAQADLEVARVALSQAIKQADRQKQMYDQGLISELDYENVLLAKEQANSNLIKTTTALEDARVRLSDTAIESPINGIILQKSVEEGQIIASGISAASGGTTIATVADMSRVSVRTSVDEVDIGQIRAGQKAVVIAESYPDREIDGEVIRIHPLAKVEQNVTTFDVTIEVDNDERLLMAGMNAGVEIIAGFKENILLVPREALTDKRTISRMVGMGSSGRGNRQGGGNRPNRPGHPGGETGNKSGHPGEGSKKPANPTKIVIAIVNGEQEPRQVEIGLANFEQAEIISGLAEGDTVLTTVSSKALQDREKFLERIRGWNQIPGMRKKK
ncbi:MAG: efflux RND transporter periplasmic adaptor subunit [candidate division Zixibacteria bacterium]|nr:efflux RND transporter periplasmic adaptor subunit [candidate division Zixibacteria bacterium]